MTQYRKAIEEFRDADGLIIDLRGNYGGIGAMTMGMASPFVEDPSPLGVMKMRNQEIKFSVNVTAEPYDKPVAVLIDECSISSAEIFSGGLKDLGVAKIFGKTTAGLALPSVIVKLPNGDGFQYAMANYVSASGGSLEGVGVIPDHKVELDRETLKTGKDPFVTSASGWIKSSKE